MATLAQRLQAEIDRANGTTSKADTTVHNAIGSLIEGYGQGGIEQVAWHQCPEVVRNYLGNVTYGPSDYTTSQIAYYAPASPVVSNTKPVGHTVDGVTFYNEIPNVGTPFSSTNKAGTVKPLDRLRWINTSTPNVRDLGGWACDGGTVKYGMLVRGGYTIASDKDIMINEIGIRHELDLREPSEATHYSLWGIPYTEVSGINYSLTDNATWKKMLRCVFDTASKNIPLYFHCAAGADRTGTLACILEAILGVSQSDIDKDYEITSFATGGSVESARKRNSDAWSGLIGAIKSVTLEGGLTDTFRNRAVSFVLSLGFTISEINEFRTAMIDGNPTAITVSMELYSIAKSGSNIIFDNSETSITEFYGYEVNLSANTGYAIETITVTMGGVDITDPVVSGTETSIKRSIFNTLANCSSPNSKTWAIHGQGYVEDIDANSEYEFSSGNVIVTMDGVDITSTSVILTGGNNLMAYSKAKILIPNVTGNIVITATATPSVTPITNLIDTYGVSANTRISASSGVNSSSDGYATVGNAPSMAIPVVSGDVIRVKGTSVSIPSSAGTPLFAMYSDDGTYSGSGAARQIFIGQTADITVTEITNGFQVVVGEYIASKGTKCRLSFGCTDTSDLIVTKNQEIV